MIDRHENSLQTAVRWAGTALFIGSLLALFYYGLVAVMHLFVPADKKAKRKVAQRLGCDITVLPEAFACYLVMYGIVALVWVIVAVGAYAILFTRADGTVPGVIGR